MSLSEPTLKPRNMRARAQADGTSDVHAVCYIFPAKRPTAMPSLFAELACLAQIANQTANLLDLGLWKVLWGNNAFLWLTIKLIGNRKSS